VGDQQIESGKLDTLIAEARAEFEQGKSSASVTHTTSSRFWTAYQIPPEDMRSLANKNFQLVKSDPSILLFISSALENCGRHELEIIIERSVWMARPGSIGFGLEPTRIMTE
jgi:hypothetical protein